jgi:hypothetical protein
MSIEKFSIFDSNEICDFVIFRRHIGDENDEQESDDDDEWDS